MGKREEFHTAHYSLPVLTESGLLPGLSGLDDLDLMFHPLTAVIGVEEAVSPEITRQGLACWFDVSYHATVIF